MLQLFFPKSNSLCFSFSKCFNCCEIRGRNSYLFKILNYQRSRSTLLEVSDSFCTLDHVPCTKWIGNTKNWLNTIMASSWLKKNNVLALMLDMWKAVIFKRWWIEWYVKCFETQYFCTLLLWLSCITIFHINLKKKVKKYFWKFLVLFCVMQNCLSTDTVTVFFWWSRIQWNVCHEKNIPESTWIQQ